MSSEFFLSFENVLFTAAMVLYFAAMILYFVFFAMMTPFFSSREERRCRSSGMRPTVPAG